MRESIADASIDLTVTSPPYDNLRLYKGHDWDFAGVAREVWRVTKPGGVVVWVVGDATVNGSETGTSFRQALHFMDIGFNLHDTMIWAKNCFSAVGALQNRYAPVFEYMFILSNGFPKTFNPLKDKKNIHGGGVKRGTIRQKDGSTKRMSNEGKKYLEFGQRFNIWDIYPEITDGHPAPFPEALARDHILSWSNPGDTVLDPFAGSGTTLKMAKMLGRKAIGIDIAAEYCELCIQRVSQDMLGMDLR
jgi:site-specific DNA-methyltransferase (adenine-specific)